MSARDLAGISSALTSWQKNPDPCAKAWPWPRDLPELPLLSMLIDIPQYKKPTIPIKMHIFNYKCSESRLPSATCMHICIHSYKDAHTHTIIYLHTDIHTPLHIHIPQYKQSTTLGKHAFLKFFPDSQLSTTYIYICIYIYRYSRSSSNVGIALLNVGHLHLGGRARC